MYYHDLTLDSGVTLNPNGFRVFVSGVLTFDDGSAIARNGNSGANHEGGAGLASGTLGGSGGGGNFGNGGSESYSLGGDGGSVNLGGVATPPPTDVGGSQVFDSATQAISGRALDGTMINGGAGGGGYDSGAVAGGGSGGGVVVVAAHTIVLTSGSADIEAVGGSGFGIGSDQADGGGGGVIAVISTSAQPSNLNLIAAGGGNYGGGNAPSGFTDWLN
jgi:hypothetical protein